MCYPNLQLFFGDVLQGGVTLCLCEEYGTSSDGSHDELCLLLVYVGILINSLLLCLMLPLCFHFRLQDKKLEIAWDNSATESEKSTLKYNEELDNCCAELLGTLKHMVVLIFQS